MPLPITSLLHLDLHLRDRTDKLPEHEKQRMIALTAINHVGSLGRAVSFLSTEKILAANFEPGVTDALLEELDAALFTIGETQACFADSAYAAVEEMFTALVELTEANSAAGEAVPASGTSPEDSDSPPEVEPKPRRLAKPGRAKAVAA